MKRFIKSLLLAVGLLSGSIVTGNAMTPQPELIRAVWDNDVARVQALLVAGTDINVRDDENGRTALMTAVRTGNVDIMNILLAGGADATLCDNENQTALMFGADFDDDAVALGMIQRLFMVGADATINTQDDVGMTALMRATAHRNFAVVQLLLAADADVLLLNNRGESALDIAEGNGYDELIAPLWARMRNVVWDIVAQDWEQLPLEVLDAEIIPFVNVV